ncbi:MAG: 5-oxoprolinase subunit PxpA [Bryobacteraceae bacterium]
MILVDINCDMGELPELVRDGTQDRLLDIVSSVNIACGGHAGDAAIIEQTIEASLLHGVRIGAHPGYPDRENFGRVPLSMPFDELAGSIAAQLARFGEIADRCGAAITHVKPHGALYNVAVNDVETAAAIAQAVSGWRTGVVLMGLAGSQMLAVFEEHGFTTAAEAFADRRYEPDGTLRSRTLPGSLLDDPAAAADQSLSIARDRVVVASDGSRISLQAATICVHSDTPGSVAIAAAVRSKLEAANIRIGMPDLPA